MYYSNDTLNSWIAYNQNLPNVIVSDLEIHYSDEKLYAATFGRGVWTSDLIIEMDSTTDSTNTALIPDIYNMGIDIFPNPNNGQFTLRINQASAGQLLMEVIDIMGKSVYQEKVRIQAMEFQNNYDLHLTSGMYFLKVSSGNRMRSLRFIVE